MQVLINKPQGFVNVNKHLQLPFFLFFKLERSTQTAHAKGPERFKEIIINNRNGGGFKLLSPLHTNPFHSILVRGNDKSLEVELFKGRIYSPVRFFFGMRGSLI